jgi:hypothetical protein
MHCDDCSPHGPSDGGGGNYPICPSFKLEDFTQFSWYTSLYIKPNSAILETNDPPPEGQLPSLRANQLKAITELEKVDQKIQSIQSFLSDAISHRARLQKLVDDYHSALSPIRRLPFEIVHKVLENVDTNEGANLRRKPDLHVTFYNGPWIFSEVCRLWRAVAIQSPEVWCDLRIEFALTKDRAYPSSGLCALLDEGVRRSASRGLRVVLNQS